MSVRHEILAASAAIAAALWYPPATWAQSVAQFYSGRSLELDISSSVGGGYDAYARMLARHIGRFIPGNPVVVAKNMEGAGGLRLANFLYNAAPRDGTTFATLYRGTVFDPLLGGKGAQFDATRIAGYPGGNDIALAMERGEVQGRCGWSWTSLKATRASWLRDKKIDILVQMGLSRHPDLPDAPLVIDLARNEEDKAILKLIFARQVMAWPYIAPPGLANGRAEALRTAFSQTMKDKDFLADADRSQLEIRPVAGEDIKKLVKGVYNTPAAIVRRTADILK